MEGYLMAHHRHPRYQVRGAKATWEPWTFWHLFGRGQISDGARAHELLNIGTHGLEFLARQTPDEGTKILVNVSIPGHPGAFVVRGTVVWIKERKGHKSLRVGVRYTKCPAELVEIVKEIGETVV